MKSILKKCLKTLFVLIFSTFIMYVIFTALNFYSWFKEEQLYPYSSVGDLVSTVDSGKIKELGDSIGLFTQVLEDSLNETYEEGNHSLAEDFDPLGFSVWSHIQMSINEVFTRSLSISILFGISIMIAYIVITSKKMKFILKFSIGYLGVLLLFPPIYMYSWTYRFWSITETFSSTPKIFYIGYTAIFILMYFINYRMSVKMAKELNQTIKNNVKEKE